MTKTALPNDICPYISSTISSSHSLKSLVDKAGNSINYRFLNVGTTTVSSEYVFFKTSCVAYEPRVPVTPRILFLKTFPF